MKKVELYFAVLISAAVLFLASCGSTSQAVSSGTGDSSIVFVALASNPSTGYSWTASVADSKVAELVSNEYVPNAASAGMTGAGGNHYFALKGKKEGSTQVTFSYARANSSPVQTRVYEVKVASDLASSLLLVSAQ